MNRFKYYAQQLLFIALPVAIILCVYFEYYTLLAFLPIALGITIWGIFDFGIRMYVNAQTKNNSKEIILSFDDGLDEKTETILDILQRENIKAVFFLIGEKLESNKALLERMIREGHSVGAHTQHHSIWFPFSFPKNAEKEIQASIDSIEKITGVKTNLFRPPFGITNPAIGYVIRKMSLRAIGWSLRSLDTKISDPQKLKQRILNRIQPGDIILMHDTQTSTVSALPEIISELKRRGFEFGVLK